jgi:hypothetical protein
MRVLVVVGDTLWEPTWPTRVGPITFLRARPDAPCAVAADAWALASPWPGAAPPPDVRVFALTPAAWLTHPDAEPAFREMADAGLVLAGLLALLGEPAPPGEALSGLMRRLAARRAVVSVVGPYLERLSALLDREHLRRRRPGGVEVAVTSLPFARLPEELADGRPVFGLWPLDPAAHPPTPRGAQLLYGHEDAALRERFADWILVPDLPERLRRGLFEVARRLGARPARSRAVR